MNIGPYYTIVLRNISMPASKFAELCKDVEAYRHFCLTFSKTDPSGIYAPYKWESYTYPAKDQDLINVCFEDVCATAQSFCKRHGIKVESVMVETVITK